MCVTGKKLQKCKSYLKIKAIKAPCSFSSNCTKGEVFPSEELHRGGVLGAQGAVPIPGDRGGAGLWPCSGLRGVRGCLNVLSN